MDAEVNGAATETAKPKKIVDRSAAYPSITIEKAIEFILPVVRSFPREGIIITREDVARVKKTSAAAIQRDVATCAQYGILLKDKEGYKISETAKLLANQFIPDTETKRIVLECFQSPKLYKDLLKYLNNHAIPDDLPYTLVKSHGISDKAAPEAAKIFIENAKFSGVLGDDGILRVDDGGESVPYANVIEDTPKREPKIFEIQEVQQNLLASVSKGVEKEIINLGNKRSFIISYPDDITKKELNIVKKHLEIIEFRISDE